MASRSIPELIGKRSAGRVLVSVSDVSPKASLSDALAKLGLHHEGQDKCRELSSAEAKELLVTILTTGLAYRSNRVMPQEAAIELVDAVMSQVFPPGAKLLTNLDGGAPQVDAQSWGQYWATDATFCLGVVARSRRAIACLWVEEED